MANPGDRVLTMREIEVALLVGAEFCNTDIAARLGVSVRTVESHITNMLRKCGVRTRSGLVAYCYAAGVFAQGSMPPRWSGRRHIQCAATLPLPGGRL
jgi:DNA-binding NarL/FixJ family response regulator